MVLKYLLFQKTKTFHTYTFKTKFQNKNFFSNPQAQRKENFENNMSKYLRARG